MHSPLVCLSFIPVFKKESSFLSVSCPCFARASSAASACVTSIPGIDVTQALAALDALAKQGQDTLKKLDSFLKTGIKLRQTSGECICGWVFGLDERSCRYTGKKNARSDKCTEQGFS